MRPHGSPNSSVPADPPPPSTSSEIVDDLQSALDQCPPPGTSPDSNPWRELLYEHLRDEALPALIWNNTITPAASLWTGSRLWTQTFRNTDLRPGDRLVLALSPSPAFIQVLVSALWEGYTVALASPTADVPGLLDALDARAAVTTGATCHAWIADDYEGPHAIPDALRAAQTPRTPDVRFLLQTSGTTARARWIALSDRNVLSVLASHLPHFALCDARVLSVLPWSHAFGLVLDLFPALLSSAEIIRDSAGGRNPASLLRLRNAWGSTHLSAVPLTVQRLFDHPEGASLLRDLQGGVVGGAPISGPLADKLAQTSLRVGYGQTEASPGIALGPPGKWEAQYLGRPVGCSVERADDGELLFEGPNACVGVWRDGSLDRADPTRTVHTGDLVEQRGDDLFFRGRKDNAFKLSNGRFVRAGALEADLKARFPALRDVLVFTPNGDDVAVAVCPNDDDGERPSQNDLADLLGPLGNRLIWATAIDPAVWSTLAKGAVDRTAMTKTLRKRYRSMSSS